MAPHDRRLSDTRERWLPLIQSLAQARGWPIGGTALEQFADAVAPFLAQPEVTNARMGIRVIEHYYHDAPLVYLLRTDSHQTGAVWRALITQIEPGVRRKALSPDDLTALCRQVVATFRTALDSHTYQRRIAALLAAIVRDVAKEQLGQTLAWRKERLDE